MNNRDLVNSLGLVIRCGITLAVSLVLIGSTLFLYQHGFEPVSTINARATAESLTHIHSILSLAFKLSPLALIQLGLMSLVFIQVIRVVLITYSYISLREGPFIIIGIFVASMMIYSLFK